jgi:hypothetical protein
MSLSEWWIDGAIARDAGGNLYAAWDTQGTNPDGSANDIGWLSFSTDGGSTWSAPVQAPPDQLEGPHIMEVAGGGAGIAYVSWLSSANAPGYGLYVRAFSTAHGWLSAAFQVSPQFGGTSVWPGDTTGISTLGANQVVVSWGGAAVANNKKSDVFAAPVSVTLGH